MPSLTKFGLTLAAVVALAACSSTPKPPVLDPAQVQRFEAQGYPGAAPVTRSEAQDMAWVQGLPARLVWTWPQRPGPHPLVVCLPGLGQGPEALAAWRQSLAEAGYVVLSWQVLGEDETPLRGDAFALRERFGVGLLQARLDRAVALLQALRSGAIRLPSTDVQADVQHMAVLGYGLGAQTAQALAGEQVVGVRPGADWAEATSGVRAWVFVSPFASFAQGSLDTRFRTIRQPVLVLTSDADQDATGQVGSPYLRTAAYAGLGSTDKALLLLHGATHGDLGQRDAQDPLSGAGAQSGLSGQRPPEGAAGRGRSGGGGMGRSGPGGGGSGGGPGGAGPGGPGDEGPGGAGENSPTKRAMQQQALRTASVAFLDAHLGSDAVARRWMAQSAARWVEPVGEWLTAPPLAR